MVAAIEWLGAASFEHALYPAGPGATVLARALERANERMTPVVFADAPALRDGEALPDIVKRPTAVDPELTTGPSPQNIRTRPFADPNPALWTWAAERCTRHPITAMTAPVTLDRYWDEPRNASVVWCKRSANPPAAHQRHTCEWLKRRWHELYTGRYPMQSEPATLARLIAEG